VKLLFLTAVLLIAHQVLGKTVRDAFFLSTFPVAALPAMKLAAALCAIGAGLSAPPLFRHFSPGATVPAAFMLSGVLHFVEFALRAGHPQLCAALVYLHIVALCAILLSSFWLLLTESFDPSSARQWFGRIAGFGTLGGIAGGLFAERWSGAGLPDAPLLLVMGLLQVLCGFTLIGRARLLPPDAAPAAPPRRSVREVLRSAPYLRSIAVIVFIGTTSAALVELLFLTAAREEFGAGPDLLRFFALFHTATQASVFLLQVFLVRFALERGGIGLNLAALPAALGAGAGAALFFPGPVSLGLARAAEFIVRGSVFRSGYEVFYAPVPPAEKRAAKSLIDVVCDRLGDATGSVLFQSALAVSFVSTYLIVLPAVAALALLNLFLSLRLGRGYSHVVHRGLTDRAEAVNEHLSQYGDWTLDSSLLESLPRHVRPVTPAQSEPEPYHPPSIDEVTRRLLALRSGDAALVRRTLAALPSSPDPLLLPAVIDLLGWNELWRSARAALLALGARHAGQLTDRLLDSHTDFSIRRRLPSILAAMPSPRTAAALVAGLEDTRFEVRLQCALALESLHREQQMPALPAEVVHAALHRELTLPLTVWRSPAILDDPPASQHPGYARLELLFALLALLHPPDPLKAAFRALHARDRLVRSLGVEYVNSLLPQDLRPLSQSLFDNLTSDPGPDAPG
jgi:HEAT repeat protein